MAVNRRVAKAQKHRRGSTRHSCQRLWAALRASVGQSARPQTLRSFRTVDGEHLLEQVARDHDLSVTTLAHVKSFLSGVLRYAKRQGILNSENPMRDAVLP
jgi:hypothetical protein